MAPFALRAETATLRPAGYGFVAARLPDRIPFDRNYDLSKPYDPATSDRYTAKDLAVGGARIGVHLNGQSLSSEGTAIIGAPVTPFRATFHANPTRLSMYDHPTLGPSLSADTKTPATGTWAIAFRAPQQGFAVRYAVRDIDGTLPTPTSLKGTPQIQVTAHSPETAHTISFPVDRIGSLGLWSDSAWIMGLTIRHTVEQGLVFDDALFNRSARRP